MGFYEDEVAKYSALISRAGGSIPVDASLTELVDIYMGMGPSRATDKGGATPGGGGGGGVTAHSGLTGLDEDGHAQYLNNARGDVRYNTKAEITSFLSGKSNTGHGHVATDISNSTATGRSLLTATDAAAARTTIGAGTSNLVVGTASNQAKAGDYQPSWTQVTDKPSFVTNFNDLADVDFNTVVPQSGNVVGFNGTTWGPVTPDPINNAAQLTAGQLNIERLTPGSVIVVDYYKTVYGSANAWPASRPTARTDIVIHWLGPTDPGPIAIAGDIIDQVG